MAIESVAITPGSGKNIAVDTIDSKEFQVVKLGIGADGALDTLVDSGQQTSANSVPVVPASDFVGLTQLGDGSSSSIKATVLDYTNSNPLAVRLTDTSGDYIAAGAGTQYTEGDTDASITGTAMLMEGAANTLVVCQGTAADGLLVNLGSNNDVTVNGTVTVGSHAVTNAGTFAVQVDGSALTALQLIDNIVHVDDAAFTLGTHSGVMAMGFAGTQSVDANDACALACTTAGALHVSDASGSLTVDNGGTFVVQVDGTALTRLTDIETNTDSGAVVGNGAAATAQRVTLANDSTGVVALTTSSATIGKLAANSGVDIGDVDVTSLPNVTLAAGTNTNEVVGDAAHDAAVAGNPVLIGMEGRTSDQTAVTSGRVTRVLATTLGKQVIYPFAIPANSWSYASPAAVTDTADDEAKGATASTRHYITGVQVFNGHDSTGTEVVIKDGSTVIWRGWAEQTGGGCSAAFNPPLRGTANTAVNVANVTNSSSTYFNLQGFSSAE